MSWYSAVVVSSAVYSQKEFPLIPSIFVVGTLVLMVFLAWHNFHLYSILSYEDHLVEWTTVVFYLAAFAHGLRFAITKRRIGDGLVALYCLLAGGEEFSWGQRLLGLAPPTFFMEGNRQQEINFHNFLSGGWHDLAFASVALGYFVLLPLLARHQSTSALLEKVGFSTPSIKLAFWATLLVCLHTWHPFYLSSEWFEAVLAGLFFIVSARLNSIKLSSKDFVGAVVVVAVVSFALMSMSVLLESSHDAENVSCSKTEAQQLLNDLLEGDPTASRLGLTSGHIRLFEATQNGLIDRSRLTRLGQAICSYEATPQTDLRRQFGVDPWGMSYWLGSEALSDGSRKLTLYSFGPNRRRDIGTALGGALNVSSDNDDILASVTVAPCQRSLRKQFQP